MTIAPWAVRENATDRNGRVEFSGSAMARIVIIGGGPAGYEAALVAAQLEADVTVVEADGAGGACVLFDCVPSKTFIASSDVVTAFHHGGSLGVRAASSDAVTLDAAAVHARVKRLALAQSADIAAKLAKAGVELVHGRARLGDDTLGHTHQVVIEPAEAPAYAVQADTVLIATGATPRVLPGAEPDGVRVLTWRDVYDPPDLP
jgi:NAD(P)H dehydrogenase (quinone)